jgi:hypothetical protein
VLNAHRCTMVRYHRRDTWLPGSVTTGVYMSKNLYRPIWHVDIEVSKHISIEMSD